MPLWTNDNELYALARRELFSAVIGDIMDTLALRTQFLPPQIRPLTPEMVVVGRAMTVLEADLTDSQYDFNGDPRLSQPFGLMLDALDGLRPGEVYLCSGASPTYALWGELMSTRAMQLGSVGAVMNGYCRDSKGIAEMGFATFSYGPYAQDQAPRGKVVDYRVPLKVGEVLAAPGDVVFGDMDGVCVVPSNAVDEVFTRALGKARGEKTVRKAIEAGMSARDAFAKYGIL